MRKMISAILAVSLVAVLIGCQNPAGNQTKSANADLSSLTVSTGALSPSFAAGTTAYTVSVPNSTANITITGTKADSNATLSANNGVAQSLSVGANTVTITVTAQDGIAAKNYIIVINRQAVSWNTVFTDNFNRPDGTIGGTWDSGSGANLVNHLLVGYGSQGAATAIATNKSIDMSQYDDFKISLTYKYNDTSSVFGIILTGVDGYYLCGNACQQAVLLRYGTTGNAPSGTPLNLVGSTASLTTSGTYILSIEYKKGLSTFIVELKSDLGVVIASGTVIDSNFGGLSNYSIMLSNSTTSIFQDTKNPQCSNITIEAYY